MEAHGDGPTDEEETDQVHNQIDEEAIFLDINEPQIAVMGEMGIKVLEQEYF